jgi:hypothetical protein
MPALAKLQSNRTIANKLVTAHPQEAGPLSYIHFIDDANRFVKHVFRRVSAATAADEDSDTRTELDSHADTCVAGANTLLVSDDNRMVSVHAYSGEYQPIPNIPVATVAMLWVHPATGQLYNLIVHEALYFGDRVEVTLLCPNQMRANGLQVEDVPRQFDPKSSHSIYVPDDKIRIPLTIEGVLSGFVCRKPTWEEYRDYPRGLDSKSQICCWQTSNGSS